MPFGHAASWSSAPPDFIRYWTHSFTGFLMWQRHSIRNSWATLYGPQPSWDGQHRSSKKQCHLWPRWCLRRLMPLSHNMSRAVFCPSPNFPEMCPFLCWICCQKCWFGPLKSLTRWMVKWWPTLAGALQFVVIWTLGCAQLLKVYYICIHFCGYGYLWCGTPCFKLFSGWHDGTCVWHMYEHTHTHLHGERYMMYDIWYMYVCLFTLEYITLHTLHSITYQHIPLHTFTYHYISLHTTTYHYIPLCNIGCHCIHIPYTFHTYYIDIDIAYMLHTH